MIQIYLNNTPVPQDEVTGIEDSSVTIRTANDAGDLVFSYSNTLRFSGSAADVIRNAIVRNPAPQLAFVDLKIIDTACNLEVFNGRITSKTISFCADSCDIEATAEDSSPQAQALACLRNTIIHDTISQDRTITTLGENEGRPSVKFKYCTETRPKAFAWTVLVLASFVLLSGAPILFLIGLTTGQPSRIFNLLSRFVSGCGYLHKGVFIYSYLTNACKLCGLTLQSSIFGVGGHLHYLTRIDAPNKEGDRDAATVDQEWKQFNAPNITAIQLLDTFKVFNIDYRIIGSTLIVERKDRFIAPLWLDLASPAHRNKILSICYTMLEETPPAGEDFRYSDDPVEQLGNVQNKRFSSLINYNNPFNPLFKGIKQSVAQYSMVNVINQFSTDSVLWEFKTSFPSLINIDVESISLQSGTFAVPKLAVYNTLTPQQQAECSRYLGSNSASSRRFLYNTELQLSTTRPDPNLPPTIRTEYLGISDPRTQPIKRFNIELKLSYCCADLLTFAIEKKILIPFDGGQLLCDIVQVQINYDKQEITATLTA